jgi:hypothetical protein
MPVDLQRWFWLADDGRVFSSERSLIVDDTDAAYLDFIAVQPAAPWPRDANGNQTELSLQAALAPHGIGISLLSYADQALFKRREAGFMHEGDFVDTRPQAADVLIQARLAVMIDPLWTTPLVTAEGTVVTIGEADILEYSTALLTFWRDCLVAYADVKLGIAGATITTKEQIDAVFAAVGD